jgi:multiple antibiotic resistance protein
MSDPGTTPAPLSYVFTIFFITMGPLRAVPTFARITAGIAPTDRRSLAWRGVLVATAVMLAVALVCAGIRDKWQVSWASMAIATGLLLLMSSLQTIHSLFSVDTHMAPPAPPSAERPAPKGWAVMPVAIPGIVTPFGIAAVLLFLAADPGDARSQLQAAALIMLIMLINLAGLMFVRTVMRLVTPAGFLVIASVFSILQAGLAIEFILTPLRRAMAAQ